VAVIATDTRFAHEVLSKVAGSSSRIPESRSWTGKRVCLRTDLRPFVWMGAWNGNEH
jgi:hypothetical protein